MRVEVTEENDRAVDLYSQHMWGQPLGVIEFRKSMV